MDIQKIGVFLSELRRQKGLTQEQLGEKLGVTNKTVSRWETGSYLPPVEILQSLSEMYGITINEILSAERLSEKEFREKAEENIKSALESSFTLKERMEYFKRKWRREHIFDYVMGMLVVIALYAAGVYWVNGLQTIGYLFCVFFVVRQNNSMMTYVEDRAFDGSGNP
ncbi:MAG: helix-turn-helix domain-containing protein [Oscillospiraceae bacterium]|nr:helix-turn-helix domain-containing protein [Oscillospiraceae bacterium]